MPSNNTWVEKQPALRKYLSLIPPESTQHHCMQFYRKYQFLEATTDRKSKKECQKLQQNSYQRENLLNQK